MSVYVNNLIDWSQLIKFGSNGIEIASYIDIKKAIVKKFQDIYGTDIDLSTNSADGIYLEFYTLMINNLLQNFQNVYSQLNINNAVGSYLDILAGLKNIRRKDATRSMAAITITNNSNSSLVITPGTTFIDINGQTWIYMADNIIKYINNVSIRNGQSKEIIVFSEEFGPIECKAGNIINFVDLTANVTISQPNDGTLGTFEESDSDLRSRCVSSLGLKSMSSVSNMESNILSVLGVKDVRVYNVVNPTSGSSFEDGTPKENGIYVVIRKDDLLSLQDSNIGQIIYNKCTPGVKTLNPTPSLGSLKAGTLKQIRISSTDYNGNIIVGTGIDIYWKEASATKCSVKFTITRTDGFSEDTIENISKNCLEYLNNIRIGEKIDENELINAIIYSDNYYMGKKTFSLGTINYKDTEGNVSATYSTTIPVNYQSYYKFTITNPTVDDTMEFEFISQ